MCFTLGPGAGEIGKIQNISVNLAILTLAINISTVTVVCTVQFNHWNMVLFMLKHAPVNMDCVLIL